MSAATELWWLSATTILTGVLWMPIIANRIQEHGLWPALKNPNHDDRPKAGWADRLMWAHANAVENLVVFAPLVLTVHLLGISSTTTVAAAATFFFARLAHAIIYTLGVPLLRTIAFVVGFAMQMTLGVTILKALT